VEDNPDTSSVIEGKFRYDLYGYGVPAGHFVSLLRSKPFKNLVDEASKFRNKEPTTKEVVKKTRKRKLPIESATAAAAGWTTGLVGAPTTLDLTPPKQHGAAAGGPGSSSSSSSAILGDQGQQQQQMAAASVLATTNEQESEESENE
jgi:hypothetical protein